MWLRTETTRTKIDDCGRLEIVAKILQSQQEHKAWLN